MYDIYEELLNKKGLKNADIARATNISNMTLSDWKKGKSTPKADKLQKIANYLNVSIEYLMNGNEKSDLSDNNYYINKGTADVAQEIFENDKILFDAYRSTSKDRLIAYAKKLEELRKMEEGE